MFLHPEKSRILKGKGLALEEKARAVSSLRHVLPERWRIFESFKEVLIETTSRYWCDFFDKIICPQGSNHDFANSLQRIKKP